MSDEAGVIAELDQLRAEVAAANQRIALTVVLTLSVGVLLYTLTLIRDGGAPA